ncbi:YceI family protein [Carboxylicivirga sp. A043]|uniref:YceI family protein n=1 Tax=Carboxylicivirga litoralis TaxID=2816963 RepID=UPI0021CB2D58|nr:YceI family protein [Carboxylicivirga sp. A043]MCU4156513.1 YceI family protein [Carboxylicivirga sp. A043]
MKKGTLLLAILTFVAVTLSSQTKKVDIALSEIIWTGEKVTGEHTGKIAFKKGKLEMTDKKIVGGEFVIDMNSITCSDIENKDYNTKLVGHLKSDDFFGVETYPESSLKLTKVTSNGDKYDVKGDLTIKGKTHPVSFKVSNSGNTFEGKFKVDRTKYDVRYGSGQFFDNLGDKMIYDEFELAFKVVVLK